MIAVGTGTDMEVEEVMAAEVIAVVLVGMVGDIMGMVGMAVREEKRRNDFSLKGLVVVWACWLSTCG